MATPTVADTVDLALIFRSHAIVYSFDVSTCPLRQSVTSKVEYWQQVHLISIPPSFGFVRVQIGGMVRVTDFTSNISHYVPQILLH